VLDKFMTLPNKITLFRLALAAAAVGSFYLTFAGHYLWSLGLFLSAMFLDLLDGYLARKLNQVSALGTFLDPLADKITISAFLICLVDQEVIPAWLALLLIFRDLIISSFRDLALSKNISIPARKSGKSKTLFQTLGVALGILALAGLNPPDRNLLEPLTFYLLLLTLFISYLSGVFIIIRNYKKVF